jgi:hypothetical protein
MSSDWQLILTLLGIVVGIPVGICWLLLPFAIFGIKPKLDVLTAEVRALKEAQASKPAAIDG